LDRSAEIRNNDTTAILLYTCVRVSNLFETQARVSDLDRYRLCAR